MQDDHPMIQSIAVCGFSLKDGMGNSQSIPKRPQSCAASVSLKCFAAPVEKSGMPGK